MQSCAIDTQLATCLMQLGHKGGIKVLVEKRGCHINPPPVSIMTKVEVLWSFRILCDFVWCILIIVFLASILINRAVEL